MAATDDDIAAIRAWIGDEPEDETEIQVVWARANGVYGSALEILRRRRAALIAEPIKLGIDGEITEDRTENLKALVSLIDELTPLAAAESANETVAPVGYVTTSTLVRPDRPRRR